MCETMINRKCGINDSISHFRFLFDVCEMYFPPINDETSERTRRAKDDRLRLPLAKRSHLIRSFIIERKR